MELPSNATFLCQEVIPNMSWYYSKDNRTYFKVYNNNKEVYTKITGLNLPNPFDLESNRLKIRKKLLDAGKDVSNFRINCTKATHNLWKHWNDQIKEDSDGNINT